MEISIPDGLWEDGNEGVISTWLYANGARVTNGAVIAELMVEKVSHDLVAPADGTLTILIAEDVPVAPGTVVGKVA